MMRLTLFNKPWHSASIFLLPLPRLVAFTWLAAIIAVPSIGCQHQGQQAIDPFWGQTRVPPPPTGTIGTTVVSPGCPPAMTSPPTSSPMTTTPMTVPGGTSPSGTPPALLPGPATPSGASVTPAAPALPATPGPASLGASSPYGYGAPAVTPSTSVAPPVAPVTPSTPPVAPRSGYSNGAAAPLPAPPATGGGASSTLGGSPSPLGVSPPTDDRYSLPPATYPGSPGSSYPGTGTGSPSATSTGTFSPTPSRPMSSPGGAGSSGSPSPNSLPSSVPPGYVPPDGSMQYRGSSWRPAGSSNQASPDGAVVTAPPDSSGRGLDSGPDIVRIPTAAEGGGSVVPTSASVPDR